MCGKRKKKKNEEGRRRGRKKKIAICFCKWDQKKEKRRGSVDELVVKLKLIHGQVTSREERFQCKKAEQHRPVFCCLLLERDVTYFSGRVPINGKKIEIKLKKKSFS